jgi:hypothetical protein
VTIGATAHPVSRREPVSEESQTQADCAVESGISTLAAA